MVIKRVKTRDFMGGKTTTTTIVVDDADAVDLLRLLDDEPQSARRRLGGSRDPIEVTGTMEMAGRKVFLSPERVEALRETLNEVYRAMERARRGNR